VLKAITKEQFIERVNYNLRTDEKGLHLSNPITIVGGRGFMSMMYSFFSQFKEKNSPLLKEFITPELGKVVIEHHYKFDHGISREKLYELYYGLPECSYWAEVFVGNQSFGFISTLTIIENETKVEVSLIQKVLNWFKSKCF